MGFPVVPQPLKYWLLDHPSIVWFRWSPTQSWGSTWPFLITSITAYITTALTLHVILKIFRRRRPVPLGPIPAIHSLAMSLISVTIFTGMLFSAGAEIRDTRWLWRRTRTTPIEWFLCFPLGIRPSGRVFFWSYVFYLSRFLHLLRTFFIILRHRKLSFFRLFNHSILLLMSFLWLEFSQSFQVLGILFSTLVYSVVYGYRFWTEIGLPSKSFTFTVNCQMVLLGCNLVCHFGVLSLHFLRGGCNGIGAWVFNSVLNAAILMLFLKSYVNMYCQRKNTSVAHHSSFDGVEDLSKQGNLIAKLKT
ncbi:ELO family [Sesbania bispinosa]|nr:ELO family [Sesbania bispinosa]